jgi:hypothetical protein
MIQPKHQHKNTLAKLSALESDLAALNLPNPDLHPHQILARRNSLNLLISELREEISEYDRLKSFINP